MVQSVRFKDFWAGLMLIALGGTTVLVSRAYPMGCAAHGCGLLSDRAPGHSCRVRPNPPHQGRAQHGPHRAELVAARLFVIPVTLILFALLLERIGFVPSLLMLIVGSAGQQRVQLLEAVSVGALLTALCVAVFVWGLGLPYPPRPAARRRVDLFANLALGFSVAFTLQNLCYGFIGVLVGTLIGVLPGIGPLATISMLLPLTYAVSRLRRSSCWRHLLRSPVRRLDHSHPGEPARRDVERCPPRRLSDGASEQGRTGAGDRGHRLVHRRHHQHPADRRGGTSAGRVRPCGSLRRRLFADGRGSSPRPRSPRATPSSRWRWWSWACCSALSAPTSAPAC